MSKTNDIQMFFHCKECIGELPQDDTSPQDYIRIEAGWTKKGLQVWCLRHDRNVIDLDFEGKKVKAE